MNFSQEVPYLNTYLVQLFFVIEIMFTLETKNND